MRLICYDDLKPLGIKYSRVQLWRLERDGMFPKRVRIGPQRHGWIEGEINNWFAERIRERDEAEHERLTDRQVAIHEAGHAVVGHLVGVAIDHVTIIPKGFVAGYSRPVRHPIAASADKLWADLSPSAASWCGELQAASSKEGYLLRKGTDAATGSLMVGPLGRPATAAGW